MMNLPWPLYTYYIHIRDNCKSFVLKWPIKSSIISSSYLQCNIPYYNPTLYQDEVNISTATSDDQLPRVIMSFVIILCICQSWETTCNINRLQFPLWRTCHMLDQDMDLASLSMFIGIDFSKIAKEGMGMQSPEQIMKSPMRKATVGALFTKRVGLN